ncbi:MAG: enoyl-CoA hydratase/isomerase family protein [Chromatocurvus sp.]
MEKTQDSATVQTHISERGVAKVVINRPMKHNAFDDSMIRGLRQAFNQLAADASVRVIVLCSNGKHFSAGGDLAWMQRMAGFDRDDNLQDAEDLAGMLLDLRQIPQPTIAQVQGAAFGGALGLVSCCDIAIAASTARFALSEVRIGLIPATIGPYVIAAIGERAARRFFVTGEAFDARSALRLGLVSEVVAPEDLETAVTQLCDTLLDNGPQAVRAAKDLITEICGLPASDELILETCRRIANLRVSDEGQEGLKAFLEKRPPSWRDGEGDA